MRRFEGQTAIVTGGGDGLGLGIADRLASEGANILIVDFNADNGKTASEKLAAHGVKTLVEVGDVGDEAVADRAAAAAMAAWGRIDVLVNNAGIAGHSANVWELTADEMDRVYRTNLRGVFNFCHSVIPHMMKRDYGRVVNIASIAGKEGNPKAVPYSATKAGVIALTKSVGKELATTGIRVNSVAPAVVRTRILEQLTKEHVDYMVSKIPMGRTGEIPEVAALVAWLASEECSFSTGAVYDISGGRATY
ncbi:MAG: SDR family NAD(P)-dependent oxidoreductase [Chloroflexi bacterium]|nr:SDR family NAD(P)-dependent oxidoreductase [Chloroflexota bacterium]